MKCYSCGGTLNDWQPNDDPWLEHAHWFPHCTYLIQIKGPEFVEDVIRNYGELVRAVSAFIRVTSWPIWPLKSPATQLFVQQHDKTTPKPHYWPLWEESTRMTEEFPSPSVRNVENCSMSWRQHDVSVIIEHLIVFKSMNLNLKKYLLVLIIIFYDVFYLKTVMTQLSHNSMSNDQWLRYQTLDGLIYCNTCMTCYHCLNQWWRRSFASPGHPFTWFNFNSSMDK